MNWIQGMNKCTGPASWDKQQGPDDLADMIAEAERLAFEAWYSTMNEAPWYEGIQRAIALNAWKARASLRTPCRGVKHSGCNYLAPCGSACNKCGHVV